jgi:hypothetical protein
MKLNEALYYYYYYYYYYSYYGTPIGINQLSDYSATFPTLVFLTVVI